MIGSGTFINSVSIIAGGLIGHFAGRLLKPDGIERGFERLGEWLKYKSGNGRDPGFTDSFVTASLTVCIGAMAIVGAIRDGILGDCSMLAVKAVLDFILIAVMTSSMGKGCVFSAIPVFIFETAGTAAGPLHDRDGHFLFITDWFCFDFLHRG